VFTCV